MTNIDLDVLASRRPRAGELAARIRAGDVAACFDADEFVADIDRVTADAHAFIAHQALLGARVPGSDDYARKVAVDAADGLLYVIGFLTGSFELQAALDDARADD
jgi:hypothetical protein